MTDLWGLEDVLIGSVWHGAAENGGTTSLIRSPDGATWEALAPPHPGFTAGTGAVHDGELHLFGYTGPFDRPAWWHYATADGERWTLVGAVTGLPASSFLIETVASEAGWLAKVGSGMEAEADDLPLGYSADGLFWEAPSIPSIDGVPYYSGLTTDGAVLMVLRKDPYADEPETVVLVSADGRTWESHPVATARSGPHWIAWNGDRYVAVGSDGGHAAWWSDDGASWQQAELRRPPGLRFEGLRLVVSTEVGFVAVGSEGDVWVSQDGETWQSHVAIPDPVAWEAFSLAALDDAIVVAGSGLEGRPTAYVGSLAELALQ